MQPKSLREPWNSKHENSASIKSTPGDFYHGVTGLRYLLKLDQNWDQPHRDKFQFAYIGISSEIMASSDIT